MSEERRETKEVEKEGKGRKKGIAKLKKQKKIFFFFLSLTGIWKMENSRTFFFWNKERKKKGLFSNCFKLLKCYFLLYFILTYFVLFTFLLLVSAVLRFR